MKRIKIDAISAFVLFGLLVSTLVFENGFYIFFPLLTIYLVFYNLQVPYTPGVFTLIACYHFLQISAGVWLCNFLNKDINYNTPSRSTATIASCMGLIFLIAPIIYYHSRMPIQTFSTLRKSVSTLSSQKVMYLYIAFFFLASALGAVAFIFGGLTQVIFSFIKIKWAFFLLFGYLCILRNENKKIFFLFVLFEFGTGFLGFFSEFKTVIFFLIILVVSLLEKMEFKHVFFTVVIGTFLGFFALAWSNIKGEYRAFLNGGQKSQEVVVDNNQAVDKLVDLSQKINADDLNGSVEGMLDRIQYTYHFAKTIDRIPAVLPFENGANWLLSLEFTTTPRILNPDKPTYDATEKTKKYTGIRYAGRQEGVSFSLGYFPDCYIDFGLYGMMGALLILGIVYMLFYSFLLKKSSAITVFNYAVAASFFQEFIALEMDSTYLLGRLFSSMVAYFIMVNFFFPWVVDFISIRQKGD